MRVPLNKSTARWYDRILAAFVFFTALPVCRFYSPRGNTPLYLMENWPLTGWVTGGLTAAVLYLASFPLPYPIAVALAMVVRALITGAANEEGLRCFVDGMASKSEDPDMVLELIKCPMAGSQGVVAVVLYELMVFTVLCSLPPGLAAITIMAADPYAKMLAGQLSVMMPHLRTNDEIEAGLTFRRMPLLAGLGFAAQGLLPMAVFVYIIMYKDIDWPLIVSLPCLVTYVLYTIINKKLRGYTLECCRAVYLLTELTFYLTVIIFSQITELTMSGVNAY